MSLFLTGLMVSFLLWGRVAPVFLLPLVLLFVGLGLLKRNTAPLGGGVLSLDDHAHRSPLRSWSGGLKLLFTLLALVLVLGAASPILSLYLFIVMTVLSVALGKTPWAFYLSLFLLPLTFLSLSALTILWGFSPQPQELLNIPLGQGFLSLSPEGQKDAFLLFHRGLASLSCLFFLSLSTPMSQLVATGEALHLPSLLLTLMVLLYRCIFVLLETYYTMTLAAASRLGFKNGMGQIKTTLFLCRNLFFTSLTKASRHFDALEARCFSGQIRFWSPKTPPSLKQVAFFSSLLLLGLALPQGGAFLAATLT